MRKAHRIGCTVVALATVLLHAWVLPLQSAAMEQERISPPPIAPPHAPPATLADPFRPGEAGATTVLDLYMDDARTLIGKESQDLLGRLSEILKRDASRQMIIEAHCDARDTSAYSLALGQHRAARIKAFLEDLGAPADRLVTVSYGRERVGCRGDQGACFEEDVRVRNAFGVLAVAQSRRGCLARLRLVGPPIPGPLKDIAPALPPLRRIHVAEPGTSPLRERPR